MDMFQYDPALLTHFPHVVGGLLLAQNLQNGATPEPLREIYLAEQQATLQRLGDTPLSQLPALAAWRSVFRGFGVDPTQYRCAAEALLRRLTKKGDIPSVNTLVDLGNLVSIRYALPIAVIDLSSLHAPITVRFASGSEHFTVLGQSEEEHPEPGEVIFVDTTEQVFARRWCWRQSEVSAAQTTTTSVLITIEAHHTEARKDVEAAVHDVQDLLHTYAGGDARTGILDAHHPTFSTNLTVEA